MKIALLGGLRVEHDGTVVSVTGAMQLALLFRLTADAGAAVSYRAIAEDLWSSTPPLNERAALQSIVSRLRAQLPPDTIESTVGGYRLAVSRADVDALLFEDLVSAAQLAPTPEEAARLATQALALWTGEPWTPSDDFDWFEKDLRADRAKAIELGGIAGLDAAGAPTRSRIPIPLTGLVGRERELGSIADQLAANRLVTIIGTGGAGKTRLAIETAATIPGSILVELASVEASELWQTLLAATGRDLRTSDGPSEPMNTKDRAIEGLAGRAVLLVVDNCEHLIDAVAEVALDLLVALPDLRILATSREALGLQGEAFVSLGSLDHPSQTQLDAGRPVGELAAFPAVELLRQRAVAARGEELDEAELRIAAAICVRLDGLPLAIELAAAKLRTMTFEEVLAGLEDRFRLLTGRNRATLPRHQTLRAMIDWSWSLLDRDERIALAGLAVFPAGIDATEAPQAARAVGLDSADVFDSLVDKSLVQRSRGRFRTLETIREYGIDRLTETGTLERARTAQAGFAADRAEAHDLQLRGPGIYDAIDWFDAEQDNLTAALRYCVTAELAELAVRLAAASGWYWIVRDRNEDAQQWFLAISPLATRVEGDEARVLAAIAPVSEVLASQAAVAGDAEAMVAQVFGALGELLQLRVKAGGSEILQLLSAVLETISSTDVTGDWQHNLRVPRGEDLSLDPWPCGVLHAARAALAQNRGDVEELGVASEEAVATLGVIGDAWGLAIAQQMRAEWLVLVGRLDEALELIERSTESMRAITSSADLMQQQLLAVGILARKGDLFGARVRVDELVAEAVEGGRRSMVQASAAALSIAAYAGDEPAAARYLELLGDPDPAWHGAPAQMLAMQYLARADYQLLLRDPDAAEVLLKEAVAAAVESHDNPVLAGVAVGLGRLCLARDDLRGAARALDLGDLFRGIGDERDPWTIRIRAAMRKAGIDGSGTEVPEQPIPALEELLTASR